MTLLEKKAVEIGVLEGVSMMAFWCQNTFFGLGCPHRQTSYRCLQGRESEYDWHSSVPERRYGTSALSKFSPDTELILYPLHGKLTSGDKSLDLSAFKLSCLFFSLLSSESSSCWRSYGAQ
ncbi:hypothetical protein Tco_1133043 [Tanacetum coccineum]|uniref:Uncharacterized protein n=1 Tax=Tanacetum coccineum TaxID=301880 RepID=A0ABQ5JDK2_9ASTR